MGNSTAVDMAFDNLELIGSIYYASMHVPPDVREVLGKRRLRKTLKTSDKRQATQRARLVLAEWCREIELARKKLKNLPDSLTEEALSWRDELRGKNQGSVGDPETLEIFLSDTVDRLEDSRGFESARKFYRIATGEMNPIPPMIDQWETYISKSVKPKTLAMYVSDVRKLSGTFTTVEELTKANIRKWLWELSEKTEGGLTEATQRRILNAISNFWRWVHSQGLVSEDAANPTIGIALHKGAQTVERLPFKSGQVVRVWEEAKRKKDHALADLIYLAAYTGARIEELCALKRADVDKSIQSFKITDAKTTAGIREIPIHKDLKQLIQKLLSESKDGFLIPSTARNNHGKRSDPLGKRFGRLKGSLGFGPELVFHSIRKTVTTQLENAGVLEGVAADILGHDKETITYGLYSGGNSMDNKMKAISNLSYPWGGPEKQSA